MGSIAEEIRSQILGALTQREKVEHEIQQSELGSFEERMQLFARLENWRRDLDEATKFCKAEAEKLSPRLMEEMGENGIQNMRIDGLTIYMKTNFYCNKKANKDGVTQQVICDALRKLGFGQIVSEEYASSALKAKVKEWVESNVEIPPELAELINYGTETVLTTMK